VSSRSSPAKNAFSFTAVHLQDLELRTGMSVLEFDILLFVVFFYIVAVSEWIVDVTDLILWSGGLLENIIEVIQVSRKFPVTEPESS
jgi:hypothetical protein